MTAPKRRARWVSILLVVIPVWLIGSAAVGIWLLQKHEEKEAAVEQARFSQAVSTPLLADDLKKIVKIIGERNATSAPANLGRMASMIDGILGPSNTGYAIKKHRGPADWPIIEVSIRGKSEENPLWIVTSYDSPAGSKGGEANASGLAATIAAAQALAAEKPARTIHFAFFPHANDLESPVLDTALIFRKIVSENPPQAILCVEAMGSAESLWITSRNTENVALTKASELGKIVGAEVACLGEDSDLASILFQLDLPAVRVATRPILTPGESDDREPFAPTVAASVGRLVELIRRLAAK